METLESLRRRMESAADLLSVVKTMKTLAAANINQYERAVASLTEYSRTLELAYQVAMRHRPEGLLPDVLEDSLEDSELWGLIVLGSDQGLAGQFNEKIVEYTLNTLNGMHIRHRDRRMVVMGRRAAGRIARTKQEVEATFPVPGGVDAIVPTVQRLLVHVAEWRSAQPVSRMLLFNNRPTSKTAYSATMTQLYPIDLSWLAATSEAAWPSLRLPVLFMEWPEYFRRLNRQYFFVTLYRAVAESLASEHAARLAAMQAAEQNIEAQLDEFQTDYQQQRQRVITDELLDIVGGFEALSGRR